MVRPTALQRPWPHTASESPVHLVSRIWVSAPRVTWSPEGQRRIRGVSLTLVDLWHPRKLELQVALLKPPPEGAPALHRVRHSQRGRFTNIRGSREWLPAGATFGQLYQRTVTCGDLGVEIEGFSPDVPIHMGNVYVQMLHEHFGLTSTAILRRAVLQSGVRFTDGVSLRGLGILRAHRQGPHAGVRGRRDHDEPESRWNGAPDARTAGSEGGGLPRAPGASVEGGSAFLEVHGEALRRVEARALMALAREGALASRRDVVRSALERWRAQPLLGKREGLAWARIYEFCGSAPGGAVVLRFLLRTTTMIRGPQTGPTVQLLRESSRLTPAGGEADTGRSRANSTERIARAPRFSRRPGLDSARRASLESRSRTTDSNPCVTLVSSSSW